MENRDILFSIIIPLYNKANHISQTINSVLSQTYRHLEVIIVDDGSEDAGAMIVRSISDSRIRYYYKENGGVSSARNKGIELARGEWIMFLDADDLLLPFCLEKFYKVITSYAGYINIVAGSPISDQRRGVESKKVFSGLVPNNYKWYFLNKFTIRPGCAAYQKEVLIKHKFNNFYQRFEDVEFILRILKSAAIYVIPDVVFVYCCTYSALSKMKNCKRDFSFFMDFKEKTFWEKCKLGELLMLAWFDYSDKRTHLLLQYQFNVIYAVIAKCKILIKNR